MGVDVPNIKRIVVGYNKIPNKNGEYPFAVEYELKPMSLAFLQSLFNINPNAADPVLRDLVACYRIDETQANALQPYVLDGEIDLKKYNFMLECYQDSD